MRLADMGVEPFLVASTLEGVLAQRLVRSFAPNAVNQSKSIAMKFLRIFLGRISIDSRRRSIERWGAVLVAEWVPRSRWDF